jgi:hypothetical protein
MRYYGVDYGVTMEHYRGMSDKKTNKSPRTLPFADNEAFVALANEVAPALESRGFTLKTQAGSHSWKGPVPKDGDASKSKRRTVAKLCFYGSKEPAYFGLRKQMIPAELLDMKWEVRGVPPRTKATFYGILVDLHTGDAAAQICKLLEACLPAQAERIDNDAFLAEVEARMQNRDDSSTEVN